CVFPGAEAARHIPPKPGGMAGGVPQLVQGRPVPVDRFEIGQWRRHLNIIMYGNIEGLISANAEVDSGRPDQRLDPWLDHVGRRWRRLDSNILRQALALRRVEHGEALEKRDAASFLPRLPRAALLILGREAVGINDGRAALTFPDITAERQGLAESQPMLGRIAVLNNGAPEDQNVNARILPGRRGIP